MMNSSRCFAHLLVAILMAGMTVTAAKAAVTVIGVQYTKDKYFDEDNCLWHDRQYPGPCSLNLNTGQVVKVFFKNTGASAVTVSDVTLAGRSMNNDIQQTTQGANYPSSIYFANLSATDLQTDVNAGEPVWYKSDPPTIPAGGVGQAVLRLRVLPVTQPISMGVVTSGGTVTTNITVDANAPVLASVGFSSDRTKVYLHWRRSGGAAPTAILMDGADVTANATTVGDPSFEFGATVLQLAAPLVNMSFHVYQGVFADGKTATGGVRTWINPFLYGTWAAKPTDPTVAAGQAWVDEATAHGVNVVVMNVASDGLTTLMGTPSGRQYMNDHGYGVVKDSPSDASEVLRMWFIRDEPDGAEGNVTGLPAGAGHNTGVLAKWAIAQGETLRGAKSDVPTTVNIDGNLKPYNYWNWGQVPDVFMTDPYYQPNLANAYLNNTVQIPLYAKATQVYVTARTAGLACEPNPLHVILYSCKQNSSSVTWPFPAPGTKRTEVYYALAGGAKGMAYWWYKLPDGMANGNADALALWKEIGLLGDEIKTAQPMLVTSHPVALPTTATAGVWVRTLAVGNNTLIFLVVNDNHYNDNIAPGCHYTPVNNATVTMTLPSWMQNPSAFEISAGGISDVSTVPNGNQLQVNLGTLNLTRMIVLTKDAQLRDTTYQRYINSVRPGICTFAPELCVCCIQPSMVMQPVSQTNAPGALTWLTAVASGSSPLNYQWQKNNVNLGDGGHYSGCTTATLTIANCDTNDAANYRCYVTNAYGNVISSAAALTVSTNPPSAPVANAATSVNGTGFTANWSSANGAAGYRLDVSTNNAFSIFVGGYQDLDAGNILNWNITGLITGKTYYYRVRAYNSNGTSGNSGAISVTTSVGPAAPIANAATSVTNSSFTANWSSSSGATGYRLDVSTDGGFASYVSGYQNLDAGNVTSRSVSGLDASTTYYYRVRAYNIGSTSDNSGTISVTTAVGPPAVPVANPATSITSTSFRANWSSANGATGYRFDVSTNSAFTNYLTGYQNLNAGALLSVNVTALSVGKGYCYRVRAYNASGTSGNSATISVTTPPTLGYARQGSDLVFSWTTNVTGYALEYTTNLPPANWTPATPAPVVVGAQYIVTNSMTDAGRCYRLRKP